VQYLISGNALMQLCLEGTTPASAWAEDKPAADLRLSLIGVGMARAWVYALEPGRRRAWALALEHRINEMQQDSGRPLPLDERVMSAWAEIRAVKLEQDMRGERGRTVLEDIGQDQRLEIATAVAYGLALVDPWARFHDQLRDMGLGRSIESLR
jgi:hypothetical protein